MLHRRFKKKNDIFIKLDRNFLYYVCDILISQLSVFEFYLLHHSWAIIFIVLTISWWFTFLFSFFANFSEWKLLSLNKDNFEKKSDICMKFGRNVLYYVLHVLTFWFFNYISVFEFYLLHHSWALLTVKWFNWL